MTVAAPISSFAVENFLEDLSLIKKCSPIDRVGSVLNQLMSSHDSIFVYDQHYHFMGLISAQQAWLYHRYPARTLVTHVLIHPIEISKKTPINLVAKYMIGTKIYTLPVFEKGQVIGAIKADSIIKLILSDKNMLDQLKLNIKVNTPITADMDTPVKKIYALLKKYKISRVVLVNKTDALAGIISLSDMLPIFVEPAQRRTRTSTKLTSNQQLRIREKTYDAEQILLRNERARSFMTNSVISVPFKTSLKTILETMQSAKIHSVVIVKENRPVGFISRHDILKALSKLCPKEQLPIIFQPAAEQLKEQLYQEVGKLQLQHFVEKVSHRKPLESVKMRFKLIKNPSGKTKIYEAHLNIQLKSGQYFIIKAKERRIDQSVNSALKKAEQLMDYYWSGRKWPHKNFKVGKKN
ncbi:MAG: hypothetical protein COU66_01765 [Candidatus Pacebacteria bacterium CG10_big_fil_rev_8_21_14_0_10_44_11]|nr:MAG: hypothetical protein COU66_01765 [Candidatus Pacebacteria bacterium CG10_big_fil_rev_8_21_14_0_10_44_11]